MALSWALCWELLEAVALGVSQRAKKVWRKRSLKAETENEGYLLRRTMCSFKKVFWF